MQLKSKKLYVIGDLLAIVLAFCLTTLARFASFQDLKLAFSNWAGFLLFLGAYAMVFLFYQPKTDIDRRGRWEELRVVLSVNVFMALLAALALYLSDSRQAFPRSFYLLFFVFDCLCMYMARLYFKSLLFSYYDRPENKRKVLVCANDSNVIKVLHKLQTSGLYDKEIVGVAVLGDRNGGLRGAASRNSDSSALLSASAEASSDSALGVSRLYEVRRGRYGTYMVSVEEPLDVYARKQVVDEAFLSLPDYDRKGLETLIQHFEAMGVNVHVSINTFGLTEREKAVENFGVYHVLTYAPRVFDSTELFLKRGMDILGALVGIVLTGILSIVVVPMIYLESPGPVIFKQTRIGLNGRRFKIYKFRSMYMDAEERKKELMAKNEMNGLMFKMKDDPRITKIGKFIRKTSIDEFPQFFNVLKGEMSLVGTRPPTEDEFLLYEERHKRRLSLKPGITGLWQVSGRSDIQDFEEVVKLDCEYIDNWSLWYDVKILVQTVLVVLLHRGAS